ncbi:MAG: PKD domain-containing protein, partial [Leadbetterella sp.]
YLYIGYFLIVTLNFQCIKNTKENVQPVETKNPINTNPNKELPVSKNPSINADFSYEILDNGRVIFTNKSENASTFSWQFGDEDSSNVKNPEHTFFLNNTYKVKLLAKNSTSISNKEIIIKIDNTHRLLNEDEYYKLYPISKDTFKLFKRGKIKYEINDFSETTVPTEIIPMYSLKSKKLFLGYWIIETHNNPNKFKDYYVFTPEVMIVKPNNQSFLSISPVFTQARGLSPINEIQGTWKISAFIKNKLSGTYDGIFESSGDKKKIKVKFTFTDVVISINN